MSDESKVIHEGGDHGCRASSGGNRADGKALPDRLFERAYAEAAGKLPPAD